MGALRPKTLPKHYAEVGQHQTREAPTTHVLREFLSRSTFVVCAPYGNTGVGSGIEPVPANGGANAEEPQKHPSPCPKETSIPANTRRKLPFREVMEENGLRFLAGEPKIADIPNMFYIPGNMVI